MGRDCKCEMQKCIALSHEAGQLAKQTDRSAFFGQRTTLLDDGIGANGVGFKHVNAIRLRRPTGPVTPDSACCDGARTEAREALKAVHPPRKIRNSRDFKRTIMTISLELQV